MAFGRKTGGRVKGTPNKKTIQMQHMLNKVFAHELKNLQLYLNTMNEAERMETLLKLMPYALPKAVLKAEEPENEEPIKVTLNL